MKDFLFVYRNDFKNQPVPSPEEMQSITKKWMDWISDIAAQNKLVDRGAPLGNEGKVVRPVDVVTDGPYTEVKELIGGFSIVKAESYDEAVEMAKGCPILEAGGNVEVREINPM
jgi:hypothetical protein